MELNRRVDEGTSWSGNERNQVFLNLGEQNGDNNLPLFADVSAVTGFDLPDDSRALVSIDWDHDGDLDFITSNRTAPRVRIFQNSLSLPPNSSLFIKLTGTKTNRDAIGSRITLQLVQHGEEIAIQRTLRAGEGFLSQSSKWIHFGLPENSSIKKLIVHWYGHKAESFARIEGGKSYHITQSQGNPVEHSFPKITIPSAPEASDTYSSLAKLERPLPLPTLPYQSLDGDARTLTPRLEKPTIIILWATWCPDCLEELSQISKQAEAIHVAGYDVLALCVDAAGEAGNLSKARAILEETKFPFKKGIATDKTLELIHLAHNTVFIRPAKLPVPTSLILGPGAKLHAVARGPVTIDDLMPALKALPDSWSDFARPAGPGIWQHGPDTVPYSGIAKELLERGWLDEAASYLLDRHSDLLADGKIYPELLMAIGTKVLANKQTERGIALLKRAVEAAPHLAAARNNLAVAYLQTGQADKASTHLEAALHIDPNFIDARLNLARYHLGIKDPRSAQTLINPVLEKGYHPKATRLQAQIHLINQDYPSLLAVFETMTSKEPNDATAWINFGKLQQQLGNTEGAIKAFERAGQLLPGNPQIKQAMDQLRPSTKRE